MSKFAFDARGYDFMAYVDCHNWIGGEWTPAASGKTVAVVNPRHGKEMGKVAWSDTADVERAIAGDHPAPGLSRREPRPGDASHGALRERRAGP